MRNGRPSQREPVGFQSRSSISVIFSGCWILLITLVLALVACRQEEKSANQFTGRESKPTEAVSTQRTAISFLSLEIPARPQVTPELIAHGAQIYAQNCAVCHGTNGDGKGEAAAFLLPKPRDLVAANYRLRTTQTGELPTDEDLFRSISLGMPGTPMPPWRHILTDSDRWALVEYVKTFSPKFKDAGEPQVVDLGKPAGESKDAIAEGKKLFTDMGCVLCHGDGGRGDGPSAATLVNDMEQRISARDFTKPSQFKSGYARKDIVRSMLTGLNGTPMLGYAGVLTNGQAWKIAQFIESLAQPERGIVDQPSKDFLVREELGEPDVKVKLIERAWRYDPNTIRVKKGQILEVTFEPTDNGLGVGHGFAVSGYDEVAFLNGAMVGVPKKVKFRADRAGEFTFYCSTQCSTDKLHPMMNGILIVEETGKMESAFLK